MRSKFNMFFVVGGIGLLTLTSSAFANSEADKQADSVTREIGRISLDIELIKKRMEHNKLMDEQRIAAGDEGEMPSQLPLVVDIFQKPGAPIMARLIYATGDTKVVGEGHDIGKGVIVSAITLGGVTVKYKKKAFPLRFAVNAAPTVQAQPGIPGQLGLPASLQGFGR